MQNFTKLALSLMMVGSALAASAQTTYAVQVGDTAIAGTQITAVDNITLTFGVEGENTFKAAKSYTTWSDATGTYVAFTEGNGLNGSATGGTVYYFEPTVNGTLEVAYVLNGSKPFFILEDGVALEGYNGVKLDAKAYKATTFEVKAGSKYAVYCTGSKLGFAGFTFTEAPSELPEFEASAVVSETEPNQYGDRKYKVTVTIENSANELTEIGAALAYSEGVIFDIWNEEEGEYDRHFTFPCTDIEGVEIGANEDVVLVCQDYMISSSSDPEYDGEFRTPGTYPATCLIALGDTNFEIVGSATFSGELTLEPSTTGIVNATFVVKNVTYNLRGQQTEKAEGLVIENGKIVLNK